MQYTCTCVCLHAHVLHDCIHEEWAAEAWRKQLKWKECTMRWGGRVRESSKYKTRKTPVVWFSRSSSRRRNALGCSVVHAPSNYPSTLSGGARLVGDQRATCCFQIKLDTYISVMITNMEPYTTLISNKPQPLLIFQSNCIVTKGFSVLDGSCDAWSDYLGFLCSLTSFIQTHI